MANKKNSEILNQITGNSSQQYQDMVMLADDLGDVQAIYETLEGYPTLKNEFLNTFVNKVIKSVYYNKLFNNPLKMLHKGKLEFGASVEQLYVNRAKKYNFDEHFDGSNSDEGDLIKSEKAKVYARYISKNFAYKYKVTISEQQLKTAFFNEYGLHQLVNNIVNSLVDASEQDEFLDMKKIIINLVEAGVDVNGVAISKQVSDIELKAPYEHKVTSTPTSIAKALKSMAGRLSFKSDKYNMAGVLQHSQKQDLVFLTTPEISAGLDVDVIANAFNVSAVDANIRIIEVDELPTRVCKTVGTLGEEKNVLGVLFEKDLLQCYDTVLENRTFDNGAKMETNIFLHKQGLMENCLYCNMVVFTAE